MVLVERGGGGVAVVVAAAFVRIETIGTILIPKHQDDQHLFWQKLE